MLTFIQQYGIFTAGQRTWGGPRADAGKADEKTTAEQVVAEAEAFGDDFNVNPETFRPAAEARTNKYLHAPLQPPSHLQGKFAPAEQLPGGWYHQANDSDASPTRMRLRRHSGHSGTPQASWRMSWQSLGLGTESSRSTLVPRRVESIVGPEAVTAYQNQQAAQRPAGGAYYEAARLPSAHRPDMVQVESTPNAILLDNAGIKKVNQRAAASTQSVGSDSSVSLHFGIPSRTLEHEVPPQARSYTPTRRLEDATETSNLALPVPTYQPGSSAVRNGRSPLARKSFTHLAPTSPTGERREVQVEVRVPRRASGPEEEDGRGRRGRRSISVDGQGRRRLSKQRHGSKEPRE
jgi:chitin synthase